MKRSAEIVRGVGFFSAKYILVCAFAALAYLSYSIPMIYSYFNSINFIYVNAWDEETYLSYQGALAAMKVPGYWFSSVIVYALQNFGLSGGEVNLLFDCVLTPLMFLVLTWSFNCLGCRVSAVFFSIVLLFSPILFNFGNPLIGSFFLREYGIFGFGFEPYQSILRTPEPQLSCFLISIAVAFYLNTKRLISLVVVLPFLYFYVAIVYFYFIVAILAFKLAGFFWKGNLRIFIACFFSYLVVSIGFAVLDSVFLSRDAFVVSSAGLYIRSHAPVIPIAGVFAVGLLAVQLILIRVNAIAYDFYSKFQLFLVISIFLVSNIHVLSGVMLSYKNYMDYAVGFVGGASLIVFIRFLLVNMIRGAGLVGGFFAVVILILTFNAYGFNFKDCEYYFFRGLQFKTVEEYHFVSRNPMTVIVPDSDLSAKIPYSVAKAVIPMFSYQYNFPFLAKGCSSVFGRMQDAFAFLKKDEPEVYRWKKDYFAHSIEVFSGRNIVPVDLTSQAVQTEFCKPLAIKGPFQVLKQEFRDDGWQRIKIF